MKEKLKRMIEITNKMKELEDEKKALSDSIIDDFWDEAVKIDGYTVTKVIKRTPKLKEGIGVDEIRSKFPTAVEFKVDVKELESIPEAHQYLALTMSEYFMIKKDK